MRRGLAVLALAVLPLAAARPAPLVADDAIPIDMGPDVECLGVAPHPPADITRGTIRADVVIARDGVSESQARSIIAKAATAFSPSAAVTRELTPDVKLNVVAVHDLTKRLKGRAVSSFHTAAKPTGSDLMAQLIRYYRTYHPTLKRHHVHLLTNRDITIGGDGGEAVVGVANCIGSIGTRYSYSISEVGVIKPGSIGPMRYLSDVDAKVAAHEIGHAFGAHHHYANCAEHAAGSLSRNRLDPCSLMFNDVGAIALRFAIAEVAAIRGYAEAHIKRSKLLP